MKREKGAGNFKTKEIKKGRREKKKYDIVNKKKVWKKGKIRLLRRAKQNK